MRFHLVRLVLLFTALGLSAAEGNTPPATVKDLWADFDPRKAPLDSKVVREWEKDQIGYRSVTFHIGEFLGKPARMAGFYAFPKGATKLPALLHIHGGGQRAFLNEVEFYAKRGYACLSINWGGREMENAQPGDANTDWGAVDPTQKNVPGYQNVKPGEKYLDSFDSPRNNNWYLLTLGARRGLTFLEQQPEVDAKRLGVYGHSMGGNLTVYVAGSDTRVKAAAPSVGGSGFRTEPWPLLPEAKKPQPNGDVKLFNATLGFESYAPRITAPVLWLGSTNDFHGIMDDTYRTGDLIPHANVRYSFTPHMNHRFTPEFAVTRPLWFDQHLKGGFALPATPVSNLILNADDHVPEFQVAPDAPLKVSEVRIYYSIDPDPVARFWRSVDVKKTGNTWTAKLPVLQTDQPLFAFANVHYSIPPAESEPHARPADRYAISSRMHTASPERLQKAGSQATDSPSLLIDDFAHGWRDWYLLEPGNPHHWEFTTRKLGDPKWRGQVGHKLAFEVQSDKPNELVIALTENFFRGYRGKSQDYAAVVKLRGGNDPQTILLGPKDFTSTEGKSPVDWKHVDQFTWRAYYGQGEALRGSKQWAGPQPKFQNLRWLPAPSQQ